jgi:rubrerythrin
MPVRPKARRLPVREVLGTALELERKVMELYVALVQAFPRPEEVRNFWFGMARHEAAHCGALLLVEAIVKSDPARGTGAKVWFDQAIVTRLRTLVAAYLQEIRAGVTLERAFEMAVDLEASELEDLVVDLLGVVRSARWRDRAVQMMIHDMGDLSYMVERYTKNERLLARADALIEQRRGGLGKAKAPAQPGVRR